MANVIKYTAGAVGHMFNHYERSSKENVKRGNEEIDATRTHLNYNLLTDETADGERTAPTSMERLKKRLSEVKHMDLSKRSDINVMCDWVITLPQDVPVDKAKDFFQHSYEFCCERYGQENVLSAWVHMDETTPHMHFSFVPVVRNKEQERLCAKECISKIELSRFHPDLQRYVEEQMNQNVGIMNGATAGGNLTITELKMRSALKELSKVKAEKGSLETLAPIIENVLSLMSDVSTSYKNLDNSLKTKKWFGNEDKARMSAVTGQLETLKKTVQSVSEASDLLKTALNDLEGVVNKNYEEIYDNLKKCQKDAEKRIKREENKIERQQKRLNERESELDAEIERGVQKKISEYDKPIKEKIALSKALDEEISDKKKQIADLNTDFWCSQNYLRQAKRNQELFAETLKEWRTEYESENVKSDL